MKREKDIPQLALSNRCVETSAQVNQVMQVIAMTSGALSQYQHQPFSFFNTETSVPKDPPPFKMTEGQIALEKTLWAACDRMEKILRDDNRWSDDFQRKIEKEYEDLHTLQMSAIEKQREAADEVTSPHFRYRPDLHRLRDGNWMAVLGDIKQLEFAVYGIGDSAQHALEEFDHVFRSGVPKSVTMWCAEREADMDAGRDLKPFPNQEQTKEKNDDSNMDSTGDSTSPNPSPEG